MPDGFWEVDVPKKASCACNRCGNLIGTDELRFQWCPVAPATDKRQFHAVCAVKASGVSKVSKDTVRKSSGLNKAQRDLLNNILNAPGEAAASALLGAATNAQAAPPAAPVAKAPSASKRTRTSSQEPVPELPLKRARATPQQEVLKRPAAAAKSRARSKMEALSEFEAQKEAIQGWSNDKLKKMLQANDQSRSGNKALLVSKCADGIVFGKLPRCPKCYGGKIKFRLPGSDGSLVSLFRLFGGAYGEDKENDEREDQISTRKRYYCTGFFDDDAKQDCDWQADSVEREPWVSA